jgi:hypothetical protein
MLRRSIAVALLIVILLACGASPIHSPTVNEPRAARIVGSALNVNLPPADWSMALCPGYQRTAVIRLGTCYDGYTTLSDMSVAWRGSIGASAYSHEAAHWMLLATGQDIDADHRDVGLWALTRELAIRLQEEGL